MASKPSVHVAERPRYRRISTRVFGDARFRSLSKPKPSGQTLWLFLLVGPHTRAVPGLFSAGPATLAEALEWPLAGFRRAWNEIENAKMARADWPARVVWIPNAIRHNPPESPNVVRGWRAAVDDIPECALKTEAIAALRAFCEGLGQGFAEAFREGFREAFVEGCAASAGKPSGKPRGNQEQDQEQEQEERPARTASVTRASAKPQPRADRPCRAGGVLAGSLPRDHADHVYCNLSHCVPRQLHAKLSGLLAPRYDGDADKAGEVLREWYPRVVETLPEGHVMGDAFKFWQPRFDKQYASKADPEPTAINGCFHHPPCLSLTEHTRRVEDEPA